MTDNPTLAEAPLEAGIHEPPAPILDALVNQGWCVWPDFLPANPVARLADECRRRHAAGAFHTAGMGAGQARVVSELRGDHVLWLEAEDPHPAVAEYQAHLEGLRQAVNRELYMGLRDLESHFALYPSGARYQRHLDRFKDDDRRALTAIVYLNGEWTAGDRGQLRFWTDPGGIGEALEFLPLGGTLVTFLSDRFWHEVLPARRERLALTGWFRRRQT